jgi:hypothetical protein
MLRQRADYEASRHIHDECAERKCRTAHPLGSAADQIPENTSRSTTQGDP